MHISFSELGKVAGITSTFNKSAVREDTELKMSQKVSKLGQSTAQVQIQLELGFT